MRSGRLRHKVTFEKQSQTVNQYGEREDVFEKVLECRCEVDWRSNTESDSGGLVSDITRVELNTRYRKQFSSDIFAVFAGTRYRIIAVLPDRRMKDCAIVCEVING